MANAAHENVSTLQKSARFQRLSHTNTWHKLIHYQPRLWGGVKSEISSEAYFLAKSGATDPEAELDATIAGMFAPETKDPNAHPQCRFISRRLWLQKKLGTKFPQHSCPGFWEWSHGNSIQSISLIFATGFLGNPASFFGHPLLKFNFKDGSSPADLMDVAVNHGAFSPPEENVVIYALKGLLGGYKSGFSQTHFFYHHHSYVELELRDLWEYELNLSPEQVEKIVTHVWDLLGMNVPYYFLTDNCASRLAELLEMVVPQRLLPRHVPYAIPYTLFDHLISAGLVESVKVIDSRQSRLIDKYTSLKKSQKKILKEIIEDHSIMESEKFEKRSIEEKTRVLETMFDYYSFRMVLDKDDLELKAKKKEVIMQRLKLPPGALEWPRRVKEAPHLGQRSVLTQVGFFQSKKFHGGGTLRARPAYYDLISPDRGRLPNSSLAIFDSEVNFTAHKLWLRKLDGIAVESLNLSHTGLPGDGGWAWRFKLGLDNQNLACAGCVVARAEGGVGKSYQLSDGAVLYAMVDPRLQTSNQGSGHLAVAPSLSALLTFADYWRANLSLGRRYFLDGSQVQEPMYGFENRFGSSREWDIRLSYFDHIDRRYALAYGYYW